MIKLPTTRTLMIAAVMLLFLVFLVAILFITNLSFSVWEQLQQKPDWIIWSYSLIVIFLSMIFGRVIWRLLIAKKKKSTPKEKSKLAVNDMDSVTERFENLGFETNTATLNTDSSSAQIPPGVKAENSSSDSREIPLNKDQKLLDEKWIAEFEASPEVLAIRAELEEYGRRKTQKTLYIALFGDISSGKSSLINALISSPENHEESKTEHEPVIETSVIGGTTREVHHYHWKNYTAADGAEQRYVLTDMPGLNEQYAEQDVLAAEEVRRAHIVIYLCDGDLTATQYDELKALLLLSKPCIVAVNKSDQYNNDELQLITDRIRQQIIQIKADVPVLNISAGGMREMIRSTPDGQEERVQRPIKPDIKALQKCLSAMMQEYGTDQLEQLREKSVASMINSKLDELDGMFKHSQSRRIVSSYTNKAVVAALATIAPGMDLLVQGYLGIQMIKDLCKIYDVPASDMDANKLIELIQSRMKKTFPLLLAIAGNGFKAFPGVGTLTGGLMHAVAYGMIFDTLGRSVARTLEVTGELSPDLVSDLYKEQLSENIESRTKDFIKLVLKLRKDH